MPGEAFAGERMDVRLRLTNTSPGRWVCSRDKDRGIKIGARLRQRAPEREESWLDYDRHAQFDGTLEAGEYLELSIPIWAPRKAGRYELKLDMVDERVTWFEERGSSPLLATLLVLERPSEGDAPRVR